jgi:hypothetical protein
MEKVNTKSVILGVMDDLNSVEKNYFSEYKNMKHSGEEKFNIIEYIKVEELLLEYKTILDKTKKLCEFATNESLLILANGLLGRKEDPTKYI